MHIYLESPEESRLVTGIRERRLRDDARFPPGLHVSTVIDAMMKDMYPEKYKMLLDEAASAGYQEIGNAFEILVARELRRKFSPWSKPASFQYRGFVMSPDGEQVPTATIHETKCTWVSAKDFVRLDDDGHIEYRSFKFMRYEYQIACYLKARGWTRARLHVWFLNGNYPKGPPKPEWPLTVRLKYREREVDELFRVVRQYAKDTHRL